MAKQMMDIGLTPTTDGGDDLLIKGGDFVVVESTAQHQRQLILNVPGDYKDDPTICVGAFNYLRDENFEGLLDAISVQFARDGMDVKSVALGANGIISTDAFYK